MAGAIKPHLGLRRAVRRAILSMARKNGKTALIAAIVLAHLVGPEAIVHGEIYSAANDRDQAAIVYKFARQMVELDHELMQMIELGAIDQDDGRAAHRVGLPRGQRRGWHQARLPAQRRDL